MSNVDERLAMLERQLECAREMKSRADAMEEDNDSADWDCVSGALEDTIANLEHSIATVDDWAAEEKQDALADEADRKSDEMMCDR